MDFQPVISDAAVSFQTRHAFVDLYIDPQVVLFDDLVREETQGVFHVLVTGHGGAVVEVLNVERHKPGVGGRYGSVEQTLRGGEAGAVGGGGARGVEYVRKENADHLIQALKKQYTISMD